MPVGRDPSAGFTIMELMVVIAIIGLIIGTSTFALRNVMRSDLRSGASRTAGAMRFAFDRATMTGMYIRLTLDLGKGEIWVEGSDDEIRLKTGEDQDAEAEREKEESDEDGDEDEAQQKEPKRKPPIPFLGPISDSDDQSGEDVDFDTQQFIKEYEEYMGPVKRPRATFKPLQGMLTKKIKLKKGVYIDGVVTPRMGAPVEKGKGYIYFFPQGHSEPAIVYLTNGDDDFYSIVLHPLTGQTRVYNCKYEVPDDFGVSDDKRKTENRDPCAKSGGV